jgi:hypothetical protein
VIHTAHTAAPNTITASKLQNAIRPLRRRRSLRARVLSGALFNSDGLYRGHRVGSRRVSTSGEGRP